VPGFLTTKLEGLAFNDAEEAASTAFFVLCPALFASTDCGGRETKRKGGVMVRGEAYPVAKTNFSLHLTASEATLTYSVRGDGKLGFREYKRWTLQPLAARYLSRCNGKRTHAEIAASLCADSQTIGDSFSGVLGAILAEQAVRALDETGALNFQSQPSSDPSPLSISGGFDSFAPLHISFEITDTCNFRCRHCYVSASPEKHGRRNGAATIEVLNLLARNGVRVVELTGGECTTHPEFKEILHHASETFDLVAVLSNGYLLGKRPDLAEFVGSHRNVAVQISIYGLRDFHDRFCQMNGAFEAACAAVRSLKLCGTFVRIAMTVTRENLDQVLGVFDLAKALGADALGVAPVTCFGRGVEAACCSGMEHYVYHRLCEILGPYSGDPLFDGEKRERMEAQENRVINCGVGWRSFTLNSDGSVRSCQFTVDSNRFGNVDKQSYEDIFRQPEMRFFHDAPFPGSAECRGVQPDGTESCKWLPVCTGCLAKAFRVSEEEYPACPWRAKWFPGMSLAIQEGSTLVPLHQRLKSKPDTVTDRRSPCATEVSSGFSV
jgi:radical SAM protein with 4Fe4S-binding SPASM domain